MLRKYDGKSFSEEPITCIKRRYRITHLPNYLAIFCKRFSKNEFFFEKNHTMVSFPLKNLDLGDLVHPKKGEEGVKSKGEWKYDLVANIVHDGKPECGSYRV